MTKGACQTSCVCSTSCVWGWLIRDWKAIYDAQISSSQEFGAREKAPTTAADCVERFSLSRLVFPPTHGIFGVHRTQPNEETTACADAATRATAVRGCGDQSWRNSWVIFPVWDVEEPYGLNTRRQKYCDNSPTLALRTKEKTGGACPKGTRL